MNIPGLYSYSAPAVCVNICRVMDCHLWAECVIMIYCEAVSPLSPMFPCNPYQQRPGSRNITTVITATDGTRITRVTRITSH